MKWPKHPVIAELDAWKWLAGLSRRTGRPLALGDVPPGEWDALAGLGLDAVWLFGVWERSPCSRLVAAEDEGFLADARRVLPDLGPGDVAGSPLAVRRYVADPRLGGPEGLAAARSELARRGLGLVLDYVTGATALDHPWVFERPDLYVGGADDDLRRTPGLFFEAGGKVIAHGRRGDGGVQREGAQLNLFCPAQRRAAAETLLSVGAQCDGVFCHGADQALSRSFGGAWGERAGAAPGRELWAEVLGPVRARCPGLLLVAETAEGGEWDLVQLGFDLCTDRRLRDRLLGGAASELLAHLGADPTFQGRLARYLGLGADPPLAASLPWDRHRAAAVALLTLPGARLLGDGQWVGRCVRVPPGLARSPEVPEDPEIGAFYRRLLGVARVPAFREGRWSRCATRGWPEDPSWENLLSWCWELGAERWLAVVNFSPGPAHGRVGLPWEGLSGRGWSLADALSGEAFVRQGGELAAEGLYVGLPPWGAHLLRVS